MNKIEVVWQSSEKTSFKLLTPLSDSYCLNIHVLMSAKNEDLPGNKTDSTKRVDSQERMISLTFCARVKVCNSAETWKIASEWEHWKPVNGQNGGSLAKLGKD